MMMKLKSNYICTQCSHIHSKFWGWCQRCGAQDALEEDIFDVSSIVIPVITEVDCIPYEQRIQSNWPEVDTLCGGGLVVGSVLLLAGEPGIGKSTFLSQLCSKINTEAIYFSGEESLHQIQMRAQRLVLNDFKIVSTSSLKEIITIINKEKPRLVVIDSIQTLRSDESISSTEQIRQNTFELIQLAKYNNTALILVGHVTKTGNIAGPKLLEHMVDVVLNFEGDQETRILRSTKNRFGSTQEFVLFSMTNTGLKVIEDPSAYLYRAHNKPSIGSVIFPSIEGSRPILVEVQALVSNSYLQMPRRSVLGWDYNRLNMVLAVLEKYTKISLGPKDIYLNIIGGMKITDSASADLAVAVTIISSVLNIPIPVDMCAFGEITLSGDVRPTGRAQDRINLACKHGVNNILSLKEVLNVVELMKRLQKLHKDI